MFKIFIYRTERYEACEAYEDWLSEDQANQIRNKRCDWVIEDFGDHCEITEVSEVEEEE